MIELLFPGTISKDNFELLCKDGSRRPLDDFRACNWGSVPTNAIVTSSATTVEDRVKLQKFLEKAAEKYSGSLLRNNTHDDRNRNPYDDRNRNPYDDRNRNPYDDRNRNQFGPQERVEYDAFGNRIGNRFKRQSFDPNFDPVFANQNSYSPQPFDTNRLNDTYPPQPGPQNENGAPYEVFNLFESSPKYGYRLNLLFQVGILTF